MCPGWPSRFVELEPEETQLHQVGRNQGAFLGAFRAKMLPHLHSFSGPMPLTQGSETGLLQALPRRPNRLEKSAGAGPLGNFDRDLSL